MRPTRYFILAMLAVGCVGPERPELPSQSVGQEQEDLVLGGTIPGCLVEPPGNWPVHYSTEVTYNLCEISVDIGPVPITDDYANLAPEYQLVEPWRPVRILEGTVIAPPSVRAEGWPHVSHEDFPASHYTHDMTFHVVPEDTPDDRYENLLAWRRLFPAGGDPDGTWLRMSDIEVEWESGLGADNDDNPCEHRITCGKFSAGHDRMDVIWNWPTVGDHVHVEGLFIWDRGHPPPTTEIHAAQLVEITRHLPAGIVPPSDPDHPHPFVYATRADVYGNGDGGAWTQAMGDRDYSFVVLQRLPPPSTTAPLRFWIQDRPGNTYPVDLRPHVRVYPNGDCDRSTAHAHITIPWQSAGVPNDRVLAKTIYLYWDEGNGVPSTYPINRYRVTLERVKVLKTHDNASRGEYRVFAEVGGDWIFVNEQFTDLHCEGFVTQTCWLDYLERQVGDTNAGQTFTVNRTFNVYVPVGDTFRIHGDGWEADGVNDAFGTRVSPENTCLDMAGYIQFRLAGLMTAATGCNDDPIGEINHTWRAGSFATPISYPALSVGNWRNDVGPCEGTDPADSFELDYRIESP